MALLIHGSYGSANDLILSISGYNYFSYFALRSEKSYDWFKSENEDYAYFNYNYYFLIY